MTTMSIYFDGISTDLSVSYQNFSLSLFLSIIVICMTRRNRSITIVCEKIIRNLLKD